MSSSIATSVPLALNGPVTYLMIRASQHAPGRHRLGVVLAHEVDRDGAQRALVAVADLVEPVVERGRAHHAALERHVGGLVEQVTFITPFSLALPARYSATVTSMPRLLHSWNPASTD